MKMQKKNRKNILLDPIFKEENFNEESSIAIGRIMIALEDTITQSITKEEYEHNAGFLKK